jgi:plasmid stability protein
MASITIRNLDENVKKALRKRAAENHRSMEAEARSIILCELLRHRSSQTLVERIREIWAGTEGLEGIIPPRDKTPVEPRVKFDEADE